MPIEADPANVLRPFEERFDTALQTWDPLPDSPLLKWIDPIYERGDKEHPRGMIRFLRVLCFVLIVSMPPFALSLLSSRAAGRGFWIDYGLRKDLYFIVWQWVAFPILTLLMLYGRRALGDMINRLDVGLGVRIPIQNRYDLRGSGVLRLLERFGRVSLSSSLFWIALILCVDTLDYLSKLRGTIPIWMVSPAESGTLFYFAGFERFQPNLAGLYVQLISSPLSVYILVLLGRLLIEFALACNLMSISLRNHVMPAHPDNSGGLLPVGRMALFLCLPIMIVGSVVTLMTLSDLFIWQKHLSGLVSFNWLLYILICPVLFLLPLLPLRRLMYRSKHAYLLRLEEMYRSFDSTQALWDSKDPLTPSRILDQFAVVQLIERVEGMSVWPFDKKMFLRFIGIMIVPVMPLIGADTTEMARKVIEVFIPK